jgi:polysaccharide export outer membrane protein
MRVVSFGATLALVVLCAAPAFAARLHPGDRIDVLVYNHPELSGTRTVDAAGSVSLPLAGDVRASGLEPGGLAELVRERLAQYVRHAAVDVRLAEQSNSLFVDGGPVGVLKYVPGETLTNVVEQLKESPAVQAVDSNDANGAPRTPSDVPLDLTNGPEDFRSVRFERDGVTSPSYDIVALRAAGDAGPALLPGDTILLARKPLGVIVGGAVRRPGTAYLTPDEPLQRALAQTGGITATGSQSGIVLRRAGVAHPISSGAPEFAQPAQKGDQLFVPTAPRVDVIGEVKKPGDTFLLGDPTLVSAVYYAGGPAEYANLRSVEVLHDGVKRSYDIAGLQRGNGGENPTLADGDVVLVPKGSTFRLSDVWQALGALGLFGARL